MSWTAPATTAAARSPATSSRPAPTGGTSTCTTATTCTVTGLTNGTAYTFVVTAANAAGTGTASTASTAVTPRTVPGAPTAVVATPGNGQAVVSWTAPASDGGSPITGYTVTPHPAGGTSTCTTATSCTVTGLTNGTAYTFTVTATNAAGSSAPSSREHLRDPAGPSPAHPPRSPQRRGNGQRRRVLDRARHGRRQPDHRLHRHAQPDRRDQHLHDRHHLHRHGPGQRHGVHLHRHRDERRRQQRAVEREHLRDAAGPSLARRPP